QPALHATIEYRRKQLRHIGAAHIDGHAFEHPRAGAAVRSIYREELGEHLLGFADQKHVEEVGDRLGGGKDRLTTDDQQWPVVTLAAPRRDAGQLEQRDDVQIVGLERNGERDDIELGDATARFERTQIAAFDDATLILVRQERPLADDAWVRVENLIHRLEA